MNDAQIAALLRQIQTGQDSGFFGKGLHETGGAYFHDGPGNDDYWAFPIYDGQTFDQGSGLYSAGPLKSYRATKALAHDGKGSNVYGGGASQQYQGSPFWDINPQTGQVMGTGNLDNQGMGGFEDAMALATAAAMTMGAGAAVAGAGAAGAGGAAGSGATVPTAAQTAASNAAFASEFAPYAAGAGGSTAAMGAGGSSLGGGGSLMGPMTEAQSLASMQGLQAELAPYLASGVAPPASLMDKLKAMGGSAASSLGGSGGSDWLGTASTLAGGLLGSQGQEAESSVSRQLPGYLQGPVMNDLIPRTQGFLNQQMEAANTAGNQMYAKGQGLLNAPVAGNGFGQVKLNAPTTATNPYLTGMADDIGRRTSEMLGQNNLAIQGNAVGAGGLGGSRQGVAQGVAAGKAADYLSGNLSNLFGTQYNNDQNRALSQYGMDQSFYGNQRGQDLAQVGVGSGLLSQGLETQWSPLKNASSIYGNFSGFGNTTNTNSQGGGWQGAAGGLLAGASLGKQMGWW